MRDSSPAWVANGYQTVAVFSSNLGRRASSSSTDQASSTPSAAGAASGPKRMPSQISRSRSFGWQNSVLLPSPVSTSQALGSAKPVR